MYLKNQKKVFRTWHVLETKDIIALGFRYELTWHGLPPTHLRALIKRRPINKNNCWKILLSLLKKYFYAETIKHVLFFTVERPLILSNVPAQKKDDVEIKAENCDEITGNVTKTSLAQRKDTAKPPVVRRVHFNFFANKTIKFDPMDDDWR